MKLLVLLSIIAILLGTTFALDSDEVRNKACQKYKDESGNEEAEYDEDKKKSKADLVKSQSEGKTYLRDYLITEEIESGDVATELIGEIIPWAVFFVISIFGMISYCYCCCCTKCACCCNKKTPLTKIDLLWPLIGTLAFCVYLIFSGSFGAGVGAVFLEDYFMMKCALMSFLADFVVGNETNPEQIFIGLIKLDQRLGEIQGEFITNAENTFAVDSDNAWIQDDYDALVALNNAPMWNPDDTVNDKYTYPPAPQTPSGTQSDSKYFNKIDRRGWRFYTTSFTEIINGAITEMKDSLLATNEEGLAITDPAFSSALADGQTSIKDFQKTLEDALSNFDKDTKDVDDIIPLINTVFSTYFSITIVFTLVTAAVSVFFIFKSSNPLRICINLSWFIFMLWAIIGFLLATIFTAISTLGFQMCSIMNTVLDDYEEFKGLGLITGSSANYIKRCKKEYGGDGLILIEFKIDQELDSMKALNDNMKQSILDAQANEADLDQIEAHIAESVVDLNTFDAFTYNFLDGDGPTTIDEVDNLDTGAGTYGTWKTAFDLLVDNTIADLTPFNTAVVDYNQKVRDYTDSLETFQADNGAVLDSASLLVTRDVNCLFLGENIGAINDALCVGLIPSIHSMTVILKVHCFGLLICSFFMVFAQHRIPKYSKEQNGNKEVGAEKGEYGAAAGDTAGQDQQYNQNM